MKRTAQWEIGTLLVVAALVLGAMEASAQYNYGTPTPAPAQTSGLEAELKTASYHAGELARKATTLATVQLHLHHVLNCLVGSSDKRFDAAAGDPCKGQGKGIIADIQSGMGKDSQYYEARWAAFVTSEALTMKTVPEAQSGAHVVSLILADLRKMK